MNFGDMNWKDQFLSAINFKTPPDKGYHRLSGMAHTPGKIGMATQNKSKDSFELLKFRTIVDGLARTETGELYANTGIQHARTVVQRLLSTAVKSADIYAADLDERVHDKAIYERLIDTIGADKVRIVLTADKDKRNKDLVRMLTARGVEIRQFDDIGSHLIVVNGNSFRVETDSEKMKAFFAFGGDKSKKFQALFDNIWKHAFMTGKSLATPAL